MKFLITPSQYLHMGVQLTIVIIKYLIYLQVCFLFLLGLINPKPVKRHSCYAWTVTMQANLRPDTHCAEMIKVQK